MIFGQVHHRTRALYPNSKTQKFFSLNPVFLFSKYQLWVNTKSVLNHGGILTLEVHLLVQPLMVICFLTIQAFNTCNSLLRTVLARNQPVVFLCRCCLLYNVYCNIVFIYFYRKQGGTRWASGKSGPLNSHAQDVLKKKSTKADKVGWAIKWEDNSFVKWVDTVATEVVGS